MKLEFAKRRIHHAVIRAWNTIPTSIVELSSLSLFKIHQTKQLMCDGISLNSLKDKRFYFVLTYSQLYEQGRCEALLVRGGEAGNCKFT